MISVIIPVYNASKYLSRCLDSIFAQTFTDWQLLLVDDGSKDDSLRVMNEYAVKDSRIKVYHKENEGVSIARQYGLDRVDTTYFIYCDADDYVEPDYLEKLHEAIEQNHSELAICAYWEEYESHQILMDTPDSSVDELIHNFLNDKVWGVTWNKLYKTSVVRENNIRFIPHLQMWEDLAFTIDYCLCASSVSCVHKPLYHYIQTSTSSITKNENLAKKWNRVTAIRHFEHSMETMDKLSEFQKSLLMVKFHVAYIAIDNIVTSERLMYFKSAFPEIFTSSFLLRKHPVVIGMVRLRMESLFYVGYFIRVIKNKIRNIFKSK